MPSNHQPDQAYASSSDSESCVDIASSRPSDPATVDVIESIINESASRSTAPLETEADFWMATRQTQCGATMSERMVSFLKALNAAQTEFADKLAAISAGELARAKAGAEDAAMYQEYWTQLQLAMRLCRVWSQSTKEMTAAIGQLITPMDRVVHIGRARLKESAIWNVELNKALSVFHTNVAKRQAKCYKALSVVMTPEYFDQSPARKGQAVRRAAPTAAKYVEQIDEANAWLAKYMSQRPALKNRLETLEAKRIEITRNALTTFATQIKTMGTVMTDSATEIIGGVASIDDAVCKSVFIVNCRQLPTPHLERPALFEYTLPVPISELGIRPVREPRPVRASFEPTRDDDQLVADVAPSTASTPRSDATTNEDGGAIGKRLTSFATMMFGGQQQPQARPAKTPSKAMTTESGLDQILDEDDNESHIESGANGEQITRFGNIIVRNEAAKSTGPLDKSPFKSVRRTSAVANISEMDSSFTANATAPSA